MSKRKNDVFLSKTLSWLLRHAAIEEGLTLSSEGFIPVSRILNHRLLRGKYTVEDIKRVVATNDKQRFFLRDIHGVLEIRANQGHSLPVVDLDLVPLTDPSSVTAVIHGTYLKNLESIKQVGLSRMHRNHIHFSHDLPNNNSVVSGARRNAQVFVYIDLPKALADDSCNICGNKVPPPIWPQHVIGKRHVFLAPKTIIVRAPFGSDKINAIDNYFGSFGKILSKEILSECAKGKLVVEYSFDVPAITEIVHMNHTLFDQKLDISWTRSGASVPPKQPLNERNNVKGETQTAPPITGKQLLDKSAANSVRGGNPTTNTSGSSQPAQGQPVEAVISKKINVNSELALEHLINSLKQGATFADQVTILYNSLKLNSAELQNSRKIIHNDLYQALTPMFALATINLFGSSITGLDIQGSDLDVYIGNVRHHSKPELATLRVIRSLIFRCKKFCDVLLISGAKIPIIKCIHTKTQICCDLNIRNKLAVVNSELIRYYLSLDEKLPKLMILIKFWADRRDLKKISLFSSYSLYMMAIFYLQQAPYNLPTVMDLQKSVPEDIVDGWNCAFSREKRPCPTLQKASIFEVAAGFFRFYSDFDYMTYVICPYLGKALRKVCFVKRLQLPDCFQLFLNHHQVFAVTDGFCIQDPFEHARNVSAVVPVICASKFVATCMQTADLMAQSQEDLLHKMLVSFLNCRGYQFAMENPDARPDEEWMTAVQETTLKVLKEVFCYEVTAAGDIATSGVTLVCAGFGNFLEKRTNVLKKMQPVLTPDVGELAKEVAITKNMNNFFPQNLSIRLSVTLKFMTEPSRVNFRLVLHTKSKMFLHVAHFLRMTLRRALAEVETAQAIIAGTAPPPGERISGEVEPSIEAIKENEANGNNLLDEVQVVENQVMTEGTNEKTDPQISSIDDETSEAAPVSGDEEEDVPPDFFDDFSNKDFMDGLELVDAWDVGTKLPEIQPPITSKSDVVVETVAVSKERHDSRKERSRSRSSLRRRKRSISITRSRENTRAEIRRDPEKTKRDIHRDKLKCARDKEEKLVKDRLKIVETGLVPPGTEMEIDISAIIAPEKRQPDRGYPKRSSSRERRKARYSRSPDTYRSRRGERAPVFRRRTSSQELRKRLRKRSRSRSRDSPRSLKRKRKEKKKKSFLEEIRDKLNETRPPPVVPTPQMYPNMYSATPVPMVVPTPVPAPAVNQFFNAQQPQYDQSFFIGDAFAMNQTPVGFNMMAGAGNVMNMPQIQPSPVPQVPNVQQLTVEETQLDAPFQSTAKITEQIADQTDDIDKLFADKKISLSDFLTITAKCEVNSSSPEQLQKKIKVIARCQDAIKELSEGRKFSGRLLVKPSSESKLKTEVQYQSPLRKIPAIRFQFTTPTKVNEEGDGFATALEKVLRKVGVKDFVNLDELTEPVPKAPTIDQETVSLTLKALTSKLSGAAVSCEECDKRKSKTFAEVGSQSASAPETVSVGVQVNTEELSPTKEISRNESMAYLTPAQLLGKEKDKQMDVDSEMHSQLTDTAEKNNSDTKEAVKEKPNLPAKGRSNVGGRSLNFDSERFYERNRPATRGYPSTFRGSPRFGRGMPHEQNFQSYRGRKPNRFGPRF